MALDTNQIVTLINSKGCEILGYSREEILGQNWFDNFIPQENIKEIRVVFERLIMGNCKGVGYNENPIVRKDGTKRIMSWHNSILYGPAGELTGLFSSGEDITLRKRAEESLVAEHRFTESLIETAQTIILVLDTQGCIIRYNRYLEDISGYKLEETRGKDWFSTFLPPGDNDKIRELFKKAVGDICTHGNVNPIVCKDGRERYIEWYDTTLRDSKENIIGVLAVGQDITKRKRIEEELNQSQKMRAIGQLAGGIAHDFNNVLAGIIGYADMALDEVVSNERLSRYMRNILRAGDRARHLVNQILTFGRQKMERKTPVNLRPVIIEVVELLKASLPSSIQLSYDMKKDTCPIIANTTKVHETVMNLSTNAMHAMDEKGELKISLREEKTDEQQLGIMGTIEPGFYSVIEVKDTGSGIDEALITRIFEPFYTTKDTGKGTGLGLSVVYGVMQSHNGNIQIQSSVGKGTIFTLFFPKAEKTATLEEETSPDIKTGHERILFVDDEDLIKEMGYDLLVSLGYRVTSTTSSLEALKILQENPDSIDLLITDQTMPNMNGLELVQEIRKINSELPIILCTGFSSKVNDEKVAELGIKALCYKPLTKRDIAEKIREVLDV